MALEESIEYFPLFDPNTKAASPGISVAVGDHVAAMCCPDAMEGAGAVTFYAYSERTGTWGYVGVMLGSYMKGSTEVRRLGSSCVAVGDTLIIGASGDDESPGRALVVRPPYGVWTYGCVPETTALSRSDPLRGDGFGTSVAYCTDGRDDYVAVGAPSAEPPRGPFGHGMVFVFKGLGESNEPWSSSPAANPDEDGTETDRFGASVAINPGVDPSGRPDGTIILVAGAPGAKGGQGAVYVGQTSEAGAWPNRFRFDEVLEPKFPDGIPEDFRTTDWATSLAMTGGVTLAVGAPADPNFEKEIEGTGAVWVYDRVDGRFVIRDVGGSLYGDDADARFGFSIAFSPSSVSDSGISQARHLLVGSPGSRTAIRYDNEAGKTFTRAEQYSCYGGKKGDKFGSAVAISDHPNGPWGVVAASGDAAAEIEGGGYLFAEGESGMKWTDPPVLTESIRFRWFNGGLDNYKKYTPKIERYL